MTRRGERVLSVQSSSAQLDLIGTVARVGKVCGSGRHLREQVGGVQNEVHGREHQMRGEREMGQGAD